MTLSLILIIGGFGLMLVSSQQQFCWCLEEVKKSFLCPAVMIRNLSKVRRKWAKQTLRPTESEPTLMLHFILTRQHGDRDHHSGLVLQVEVP